MNRFLKFPFLILIVFCFSVITSVTNAATNSIGQNIGVTVDNSSVVVPEAPVIVRSQNISTNALELVVKVGDDFSSESLNFVVTVTNGFTGEIISLNFTQNSDINAQSILEISSLDPGTEYQFSVRYARVGGVYSAESNIHLAKTLIEPPVLNSVSNIEDNVVDLDLSVDSKFIGTMMDFIVEVVSESGDAYTMQVTKQITDSHVLININELTANTGYTFRVKYARENTMYFSEYSNEKTTTTGGGEEILDKPVINSIQNITTDSVELVVEVSGHNNEKLDFIVVVVNKNTGEKFEIDFSEKTSSKGVVILGIAGLEPSTEYEFKVKFAIKGDDNYSSYSNIKSVKIIKEENEKNIICYNGAVMSVSQDELQFYLNKGAIVGQCEEVINEKKIKICHNGQDTLEIAKSAVQAHLDHGDALGPCEKYDEISGGSSVVDDANWRKAIITPEQKSKYQTASIVGVASAAATAIATVIMPLLSAMPGTLSGSIFLRILELFGIVGKRNEKNNWGIVFDGDTHMPLVAAKIVLSNQSGEDLLTTYSDREGRFGFLAKEGTYVIQVFKKGYTLVENKKEDALYGDVYNGRNITVDSNRIVLTNIEMKSNVINWTEYSKKRFAQYKISVFMKYLFIAVYIFGFGATIIITFFYPSIFNFIILNIYIIMLGYKLFVKKKKYGSIETNSGEPVPFAVVNLYDKNTNEKHKFAVTDAMGRYYMLADNGAYNLKAKGQPAGGVQFEKHEEVKVNDGIVRKDVVI